MDAELTTSYGDWEYEESLDGYGPATHHVWVNDRINGVVKVCLSEGMHIMKGERGDWLILVNIGSGGIDTHYTFDSEEEALDNVKDLIT